MVAGNELSVEYTFVDSYPQSSLTDDAKITLFLSRVDKEVLFEQTFRGSGVITGVIPGVNKLKKGYELDFDKAKEYYNYKQKLIPVIQEAFYSLEREYDVIIVEGAGSPAEINLKENDIVNMGIAKMFNIPVLLVGDIDLGGVFAQLLGTLEWLDKDEKEIIKGLIINKFRGDETLLKPGIDMLNERTGKEVLGVVPYSKAKIDEEDSVTVDLGKTDNKKESFILIHVVRLPHMSNFTDFTPLSIIPGISVEYISEVPNKDADLIIIPGTKSTVSDLNFMKNNGLSDYVISRKNIVPIIGICGGNQILGKDILDPFGIEGDHSANGLSLLNQSTVLSSKKTLVKKSGTLQCKEGFFKCIDNTQYDGYEIHCGVTNEAVCEGDVFGTYIHGLFDNSSVTKPLIRAIIEKKCEYITDKQKSQILDSITDYKDVKNIEYDMAAKVLRSSLDMNKIFEIMGINT